MTRIHEVISDTKAIIKVEVERKVKIYLSHDFTSIGGEIYFETDLQLSLRGSDFTVYANTGYEEHVRDSNLIVAIINGLFSVRSGVKRVDIKAFGFMVSVSAAIDCSVIINRVIDVASAVGYTVEFRNLDAEKRVRRGF